MLIIRKDAIDEWREDNNSHAAFFLLHIAAIPNDNDFR